MSLVQKLMHLATKLDSKDAQIVINAAVTITSLKLEITNSEQENEKVYELANDPYPNRLYPDVEMN